MRYNKNKKKRQERICDVCRLNKTGDELHYLQRCLNSEIVYARQKFIELVKATNSQFEQFSDQNIFQYSLTMKDPAIQAPFAKFVKTILDTFKEETQIREKAVEVPIRTKSGRLVKKPKRLDL